MTSLIRLYSKLLHLYPARFRDEFAEEMQVVFSDSVNDAIKNGFLPFAILCLRELGGLPLNILREFWHEFQGKELIMLHENTSDSRVTATQVIMGVLPFFLFSLVSIMLEFPIAWLKTEWFMPIAEIFLFAWLTLPAIGFGIGWVQDFPRWSYPYTGIAVILAFYIQNASTPGLNFFGIPLFGRELWGWRAWAPLAMAFVIALIISRSFKPFLRFFINLWQDWTIPSYLMAGALPLLVMITFDEIDHLYTLYFVIPFAALLVGMVVIYLRSQRTWQRVLALTVGVLIIIFSAAFGSNSYWLSHNGMYLSGARYYLVLGAKISLIMLAPAWLELLRRWIGRIRFTDPIEPSSSEF
jgi:hypothetical protein